MDFTTNYCGVYWSDGTIQSSVDGTMLPVDELDEQCRQHDSSYFYSDDPVVRSTADNKFYENTKKLGLRGNLYGNLVLHGNKVMRYIFSPTFKKSGKSLRGNDTSRVQEPGASAIAALRASKSGASKSSVAPEPSSSGEYVDFAGASRVLPTTLYKPLNRNKKKKKIVPIITKNMRKTEKSTKMTPPANKTIASIKDASAKIKTQKEHVDQDTCTHPQIRTCYNYKYCSRCNREFH